MAVRLSALRAGRPLPPGRFLVLTCVRGWVDPRVIVRLEGLGQLENSNNLNPNRTRDLPPCSIVPQPTMLLRAPTSHIFYKLSLSASNYTYIKFIHESLINFFYEVNNNRTLPLYHMILVLHKPMNSSCRAVRAKLYDITHTSRYDAAWWSGQYTRNRSLYALNFIRLPRVVRVVDIGKVKWVPVLKSTSPTPSKHMGEWRYSSIMIDFENSLRRVVSFTPRPL
jgi:hypothetical protein